MRNSDLLVSSALGKGESNFFELPIIQIKTELNSLSNARICLFFFLPRFFEPPVFPLYIRIRTNATCCFNLLSWGGCRSFYKSHLQYLVFCFASSNGKKLLHSDFFGGGGGGGG